MKTAVKFCIVLAVTLTGLAGKLQAQNIAVTGKVTAANLSVTSQASASNISVTGQVEAGSLSGTLSSTALSSITSIGTLSTLTVSGMITTANLTATNLINAASITSSGTVGASILSSTGNLFVGGNANIGGQLTVTGSVNVASLTSSGTVAASILSSTGNLFVGGNANIGGQLTVTGALNVASLTSSGTIAASILSSTGNLFVAGNANIGGQLTVTGSVYLANLTSSGVITAGSFSGTHLLSTSAGVAAAGTTQANATPISAAVNVVTSGTTNQGLILSAGSPVGARIVIVNQTSAVIKVYPQSGAQIDALGSNTGLPIPVGGTVALLYTASNQWYTSGYDGPASPYFQAGALASKTTIQSFTTTEVQILGVTIPANTMAAGTSFRIRLQGVITAGNASANTFRIRIGTTSLAGNTACQLSPTGTNAASIPFALEGVVTIMASGASGTITGGMTLLNVGTTGVANAAVTISQPLAPVAVDTTADKILEITGQTAGATLQIRSAILEITKL